jgi:tetratricopeptide (TPR) repeat protein
MTRRLLPWLLVGVLAYAGPAVAAPDSAGKIAAMQPDVDRLDARLREIMKNYENRRGLIGAVDARIRYEDGVYDFLVGHYEEAANSFFVLVRSGGAGDTSYTIRSGMAAGALRIGTPDRVEAYGTIVEAGPLHPFFADAVRRQLEIYGILRDTKRFDDLYALYIATGQVPSTDIVKYTVAKSYYRQGDHGRALQVLAEIGPESPYYGRAGYLAGVVLTADSKFADAIPHFVAVAQLEPKSSLDRAVMEAATMAAARLYYETGQYTLAAEAYSRLTHESEYFADELYELVWTFIEQDAWADAIRAIDTFLIAFPEHRYAMQLQLLRGHLHVKQETFPDALTAYENVVHDYTPMRDKIATIDLDREDPVAFFDRVASSGTIEVGGQPLPPYVTEMLFSDDVMARARAAHDQMHAESSDPASTRRSPTSRPRSPRRPTPSAVPLGRRAIGELLTKCRASWRDDDERGRLPGRQPSQTMQPDVDGLEAEIAVLAAEAERPLREGAATNRTTPYDSQVRATRAGSSARGRDAGSADADPLESLVSNATLSEAERTTVSQKLETTRTQQRDTQAELDALNADMARHKELAAASSATTGLPDHADTLAQYRALQSKIVGYRSDVAASDAAAVFAAADKIWAVTAVDDDATSPHTQPEARSSGSRCSRKSSLPRRGTSPTAPPRSPARGSPRRPSSGR